MNVALSSLFDVPIPLALKQQSLEMNVEAFQGLSGALWF